MSVKTSVEYELGYLGIPNVRPGVPGAKYSRDLFHTVRTYSTTDLSVEEFDLMLSEMPGVHEHIGRVISHGASGGTLQKSTLAEWWVWRANDVGVDQAKAEVADYLSRDNAEVLHVYWLFNTNVSSKMSLVDDIEVWPAVDLPDSADKHVALTIDAEFMPHYMYRPTAALVIRRSEPKFTASNSMQDITEKFKNAALVLNLLPSAICCGGYRTAYRPSHVPFGPFEPTKSVFYPAPDILVQKDCVIDMKEVLAAPSYYTALTSLPGDQKILFETALLRLGQAKGASKLHNAMLDLGIALEILLLKDAHKSDELPGQLAEKFRLRGAWLLGSEWKSRKKIYGQLGDVYRARSQVAHTGRTHETDGLIDPDKIAPFIQVGEWVIRELLAGGGIPNWNDLVLGRNM